MDISNASFLRQSGGYSHLGLEPSADGGCCVQAEVPNRGCSAADPGSERHARSVPEVFRHRDRKQQNDVRCALTCRCKAQRVMDTLAVLIPNVGDPQENMRCLFMSVVYSMMLYSHPTWGFLLLYNRRAINALVAVQRKVAIRSISRYYTVSYDAVPSTWWPLNASKHSKSDGCLA